MIIAIFPNPIYHPFILQKKKLMKFRAEIPELPQQKRERFKKDYQLDEKSIEFFIYNKILGENFEKIIKKLSPKEFNQELIKLTANSLINDIEKPYRLLLNGLDLEQRISFIENFKKFIIFIKKEKISTTERKDILKEMILNYEKPFEDYINVNKGGLFSVDDEETLQLQVEIVIKNNPKVVEDYKKGKENASQFLIGQVMKNITENQGRANPEKIRDILIKKLTNIK